MLLSAREIAERWGLTSRRVAQLCAAGAVDGAVKEGRYWMIPEEASIPVAVRNKTVAEKQLFLKEQSFTTQQPLPRTTKILPCPIGITSYKEAASGYYYVDKTLFIRDILDERSKVYLFTRPRRFGKTLMMDMVKTFFEKSKEDTSVYFQNKKIWKEGNTYREYQGKFPVIFLSFKDAHQDNWTDMYQSLRYAIKKEFRRHKVLVENEELPEAERRYFTEVLNTEIAEIDCQNALGELSYMLSLYYGSKVIIIIDEYDTPIQQGYLNGYYDKVTAFMRNLFSAAFKDNEYLEFGLLTGILRVAKESLFSGLNNLVVNTVLDEKYATYFGFTEPEVQKITAYYDRSEKTDEIRKWYDGYYFGNKEIYNPWSVLNYINNNCKAKAFWSRTSSNDIIRGLIENGNAELYDSLEKLLQGKEIQALIDSDIIYPEINGNADTIYSFLLMSGYLKVTGTISEINDIPICSLQIPNLEIQSVFQKEILGTWNQLFTGTVLKNFELALFTGNEELFQNTLSGFLLNSASCLDTAHENFYHGMMLGMLAAFSDAYVIASNRESGEGRFDIQLEPRNKKNQGYILEFKALKDADQNQLVKEAEKAIRQVQEKSYAADLKNRGVSKIKVYGIAFSGKKAWVKCS